MRVQSFRLLWLQGVRPCPQCLCARCHAAALLLLGEVRHCRPPCASAEVMGHVPGQGSLPALLPFKVLLSRRPSPCLTYLLTSGCLEGRQICSAKEVALCWEAKVGGGSRQGRKCPRSEGLSVLGFSCCLCQGSPGRSTAPGPAPCSEVVNLSEELKCLCRAEPAPSSPAPGGGCSAENPNLLWGLLQHRGRGAGARVFSASFGSSPAPFPLGSPACSTITAGIRAARQDWLHRPGQRQLRRSPQRERGDTEGRCGGLQGPSLSPFPTGAGWGAVDAAHSVAPG